MRTQWKVMILVLVVWLGLSATVAWKAESLLLQDKLDFITDSSMKQIAPLKRLVQEKLDDEKARLVRFAAARANTGAAKSFGDFDVIALVKPSDNGQWAPTWVEKSSNARQERWPNEHELTLLKSLPFAKLKDGQGLWARVSDRQGSPVYAYMISVEIQNAAGTQAPEAASPLPDGVDYSAVAMGSSDRAVVVGFASSNPLAAVSEDYIGSTNAVYIVDDRGYIASHVNKAYLGALFTEDPIVSEVVKARKTSGSGRYEDLESRAVLGHFERIDRTNLYAVITTPLETATALVEANVRTLLATCFAVGLFCLGLAYVVGRSMSRQSARSHADEMKEAVDFEKASSDSEVVTEAPARVEQQVKAETSATVKTDGINEGFASIMSEPLLAILGHAQLTKAKAESEDIRAHAESIEREARSAKGLLERLRNWSEGITPVTSDETMNLVEVVEAVLEKASVGLEEDGIRVTKDLNSVPVIRGSSEQIKTALSHLIENAREAMRARTQKSLRLELEYVNDRIFLSVTDTGVGMARDVKERAFDPFFKNFDSADRMGLGLSFVRTALNRIGAECEVESVPGDGSTFTMKFSVTAAEAQEFAAPAADANEEIFIPMSPAAPLVRNRESDVEATTSAEKAPDSSDDLDSALISITRLEDFEPSQLAALDFEEDEELKSAHASSKDTLDELVDLGTIAEVQAEVSAAASFLDDDDDDDGPFASMAINQAAETMSSTEKPVVAEVVHEEIVSTAGAEPVTGKSGFRVRIRRPKLGK